MVVDIAYIRLRIFYLNPFNLNEKTILDRVNSLANYINGISLKVGYRFTGATVARHPPCSNCFDMWFRREGSPVSIPAAVIITVFIITVGVIVYRWTILEERKIVIDEIRETQTVFNECIRVTGDPKQCSQLIASIPRAERGPLESLSNIILFGVGGLVALEILKNLRGR